MNSSPFLTVVGIPWREKISFGFGNTDLADVDGIISSSGNRLYSSMTTNKLSRDGKGSAKSMACELHGSEGKGVV